MRRFLFIIPIVLLMGCSMLGTNTTERIGTLKNLAGAPSIVEVAPGIFIGNMWDARNADELKRFGITAILNVAADIDDPPVPSMRMAKVGLYETRSPETAANLHRAIYQLDEWHGQGCRVLVHCRVGENRTPWVVAHWLSHRNGTLWRDEFTQIKMKRPECFIKDWMF